jgi:threonylcarbamoyladenosine tRNA methylthiotransferase MtaB
VNDDTTNSASSPPPLRVAVTALGCKVNYAEMADLAGVLAAAGCDVVPDTEPADVRVLNSCTVTLQADGTSRRRLRRMRREDPGAHLVLTGCSVDGNPGVFQRTDGAGRHLLPPGVDAVFSNAVKADIAAHVQHLAEARGARPGGAFAAPKRTRAFIKVQDGCDHRCTYCSVWRARGASRSVPTAEVMRRAAAAVENGFHELVITGVDLGAYGRAEGSSLAALVTGMLGEVGPAARVRLSSVNTNDITPQLLDLTAHPQLCSHWHMPLQSGSDSVLKAMHRGYRRRQYLRVCAEMRARDPDVEFTTDIMVGFPGETDEDHRQTREIIAETGMLAAHVFRYSARPGTPAATLPGQVDGEVARRRSADIRRAAAESGAARRRRAVGRHHRVVWESGDGDTATGFTATYLEACAEASAKTRPGDVAEVRIDALEGDRLRATLLAP